MNHEILERFNNERYNDDTSMEIEASNHYLRYEKISYYVKHYVEKNTMQSEIKLLDVGCGPGHLMYFLPKANNLSVFGCDISENSLQRAREKGMKTVKCNLWEKFPFPDESFDVIVASEVIEHIYDTETFIRELKRIMKKDGILIITTPNVASLGRRVMLLFGMNPILEYKLSGGAGHIRYFTFKDMKHFLRENGFDILVLETDTVNISFSGKIHWKYLGRLIPTWGRCIFCVVKKQIS